MSIYGTMMEIGIRRFGDKEFINLLVQAVAPHFDSTGVEWAFLPPPVDPNGTTMRAVFFVETNYKKGTPRNGQEYVDPLLMLTGREYEQISFVELMARLEDALERKYGKEPSIIYRDLDGTEHRAY